MFDCEVCGQVTDSWCDVKGTTICLSCLRDDPAAKQLVMEIEAREETEWARIQNLMLQEITNG